MNRIFLCWLTGLVFWTGVAAAAPVTCQTFTPSGAIQPGVPFESPVFDVSAYDYYSLYFTYRFENQTPPFDITVFHGADIPPLFQGFVFKVYTGIDFIGPQPAEWRLNTETEWITRSPIRILINNTASGPEFLQHASICFGRIQPPAAAGAGGGTTLAAIALPVLLGALLLRSRQARCGGT
jgi:hypothetical protein